MFPFWPITGRDEEERALRDERAGSRSSRAATCFHKHPVTRTSDHTAELCFGRNYLGRARNPWFHPRNITTQASMTPNVCLQPQPRSEATWEP